MSRIAVFSAAVLVLAAMIAGCAGDEPVSVRAPKRASIAEPGSPVNLDAVELVLDPVVGGLSRPVFVMSAPDGLRRLFVVEQGGLVRIVRDGQVLEEPYLDLSRWISAGGERGLLGLAFAPDYKRSGVLYVNFTDSEGDTVVARMTADDPLSNIPSFRGPTTVLKIGQPYANHNGGCIVFEPGTKRLWVGMGDGGAGGDPENRAQNPDELLGKMLVLDFSAKKPKPKIVQSGLRNPWRFSFDRKTGDLWIGDVGQNAWEEIDFTAADQLSGINWGWRLWEGSHPYPEDSDPPRDGLTFPITEYGHDDGRSVTGGYVYRGAEYPELQGIYLYADFESGFIAGLQRTGAKGKPLAKVRERVLVTNAGNPSSFGEDADGELYLCEWGSGTLYRVRAQVR